MTREEFLKKMDKVASGIFYASGETTFTCNQMNWTFGEDSEPAMLYSHIYNHPRDTLEIYDCDTELWPNRMQTASARVCALKVFELYVLENKLYLPWKLERPRYGNN